MTAARGADLREMAAIGWREGHSQPETAGEAARAALAIGNLISPPLRAAVAARQQRAAKRKAKAA